MLVHNWIDTVLLADIPPPQSATLGIEDSRIVVQLTRWGWTFSRAEDSIQNRQHNDPAPCRNISTWNQLSTSTQPSTLHGTAKWVPTSLVNGRAKFYVPLNKLQVILWTVTRGLVEQGLTSHSTQFRSFQRRRFYRLDDPTNHVKALEGITCTGTDNEKWQQEIKLSQKPKQQQQQKQHKQQNRN